MFFVSITALALPFRLDGIPMLGNACLMGLVTLWFVLILVLAGFGCSALLGDSLLASEMFAIVAMPSFLISGYTWPVFAMPAGLKIIAYALPLSHYSIILRKIFIMGAPAGYFGVHAAALGVWSLLSLLLAYKGAGKLVGRRSNA
jgi:ABC-2 type transport system permease protein